MGGGGGGGYPGLSAAVGRFALAAEGAGPHRHPHAPAGPRYRPYSNGVGGF